MWPAVTIEIAFGSDDLRTPATWLAWVDVSAYTRQWGYKRGRQRQLQRVEAGTAYLILDNADGRFDPENSASPHYGAGAGMRPGVHVRIIATWGGVSYPLFYGYVTAWVIQDLAGSSLPTVRIELLDLTGWLGRTTRTVGTDTVLAAGAAIRASLYDISAVSSDDTLLLDAGTENIPAIADAQVNPWGLIQSIADTEENGLVFQDGAGRFVFHDRLRRYGRERSIVIQALFDNEAAAQAAGSLPFAKVVYRRDETEFYTDVVVTSVVDSTPRQATDSSLAARYYRRTLSRSTRHGAGTGIFLARRLRDRAAALMHTHGLGQHTSLTIEAGNNVAALWPAALGLTISDLVRVTERLYPNGRTRTVDSFVEGVQADVDPAAHSWRVTYSLSRVLREFHWIIRGKGVAFPSYPSTNDLYYREDLDLLCYYDGSRWLTAQEYVEPLSNWVTLPFPSNAAATNVALATGGLTYSRWLLSLRVTFYVYGANNLSNYWILRAISAATAGVLSTTDTATRNGGTWYTIDLPLNTASLDPIHLQLQAIGNPSPLYYTAALRYRLIIT